MRILRSVVATLASLVLVGLGTQTAFADEHPAATWVDGVEVTVPGIDSRAELDDFLTSSTPKAVVLDVDSGQVVAVGLDQAIAQGRTAVTSVCHAGNACLVGPGVPYADYGFSGIGSVTGTWASRHSLRSGSYTVSVTFATGVVSQPVAPNTHALFSAPSTVSAVRLS